MKKITVSLGNIGDAIRQVEQYEKQVETKVKELLEKLLDEGVDIAKAKIVELDAVEYGELYASLKNTLYKEENKGIIFTDCPWACYVEFGTGVKGANKQHPDLPIGWKYDVNGHEENGWYYFDEKQGRVRFTKGMPSRPFMYLTARELENRVVKIAKEIFEQ